MAETKTMKALILESFGTPIVLKEVAIPEPAEGEVQIKVEASPINPSDAMFMKGSYSNSRTVPCVPGFEGSGVVVKSGGSAYADSLVGKRVAFTTSGQHGAYAQYTVTDAKQVIPVGDNVSFNQASCSFVNPMTVLSMLEVVKEAGVTTVVHSAAASALGRMMVRYFAQNGVKVINIVRRQEQVEILKKEGAEYILNSSDENYLKDLKTLAAEHKATIFFDPIAGPETGAVLNNMPNNSIAYVYGALSMKEATISPIQLIFRNQQIRGFWLTQYLGQIKPEAFMQLIGKLTTLLTSDLKTEVSKESPLSEAAEAVHFYLKNMSSGKVLFKPNTV